VRQSSISSSEDSEMFTKVHRLVYQSVHQQAACQGDRATDSRCPRIWTGRVPLRSALADAAGRRRAALQKNLRHAAAASVPTSAWRTPSAITLVVFALTLTQDVGV
jgi:hypothetical protein